MSAFVLATCLFLVVALVITSVVLFVRSHREHDSVGGLIGMTAMIFAGFPAAAYGAMTGSL